MRRIAAQFARFGLVGLGGFAIDFGVFNLLRLTVFAPENLHEGPVLAKVVSTTLAIVFNWVGNRLWTFREHRGPQLAREGLAFGVVSVGGMLIGLGCLWISHYALGFTSPLADNISSNVIGLGLGTIFRFGLYRWWVFRPRSGDAQPLFDDESPAATIEDATATATSSSPAEPRSSEPRSGQPHSDQPRVGDVSG